MEQLGGYQKLNFKPEHCSPTSDINNGSCLDPDMILKVAKSLNQIIKDKNEYEKIDLNSKTNDIHNEICKLLTKITGCSSESCWMNIKKLMEKLGKDKEKFKDSFKPIMPKKWIKDYNTWLRTNDIEESLNQYHNANKQFYFYGALPIDFDDCSVSDLCSINLKEHISNGIKKIGIVFNTDPHDESGEHWISLFVDIDGTNLNRIPGIYYYDSYGNKAPDEIEELVQKLKKQGSKINKDFKYLYNDYSYQKENYQCGMYAIHFIKEMLKGIPFKKFLDKHKLTDKNMLNKRKEYFISPEEIKCKYNL